jgi:hypothetical protein
MSKLLKDSHGEKITDNCYAGALIKGPEEVSEYSCLYMY